MKTRQREKRKQGHVNNCLVKNVEVIQFKWAYVDPLSGKLELASVAKLFRVVNGHKFPFLPRHKTDFDVKEKYAWAQKCPPTCNTRHRHTNYRLVFIKLLGSKYSKNSMPNLEKQRFSQ